MTTVTLLDKWQAMEAVAASDLPPAAKLVYFRLLAHMNTKTGRCDPSYQTLANGTSLTRRGIIDMIKLLETVDLLTVERSSGGAPGSGNSVNRYVIHLPSGGEDSSLGVVNKFHQGSEDSSLGVVKTVHQRGEENSTRGVNTVHPNTVIEHGKETGNLNTGNEHVPRERHFDRGSVEEGPDIDESFRSFWKQYPRKVNEKKARAAYARAIRSGAAPDMIMQAAMRYVAERSGQSERYTAHAATWLDNRRWEDEAPRRDRGTVLDAAGNVIEFPAPKQSFDSYDDAELDRLARICKTGKYRP